MKKIYYGWWVVCGSFALAFLIGGAAYFSFTAFYEPIIQEFNWSYTQVSIAFSIRGLEMGLLAPVAGILVDRYGARVPILVGISLIGSALLFLSQVDSLAMFYGAFVILSIGASGCASTVLMTALAGWFKKNAGKAMGIASSGFGVGGLMLALIVYLIEVYKWRNTLIFLGAMVLVFGLPLSFIVGKRPGKNSESNLERAPSTGCKAGPAETQWLGIPFAQAVRTSIFWKICLVEAIRVANTITVVTHIMPYLASMGMPRYQAAWLATAIPLTSAVGRIFLVGFATDSIKNGSGLRA